VYAIVAGIMAVAPEEVLTELGNFSVDFPT
jgi:hypothetical protein